MDFSVLLTVIVSCQGYTWHSYKKGNMFWTPIFQKSIRENKLWKYNKLLIYGYLHEGYLRVALKIKAGWGKLLLFSFTIMFPSTRQNLLQKKCIPFQQYGLFCCFFFVCLLVCNFLLQAAFGSGTGYVFLEVSCSHRCFYPTFCY